MHDQVSKPSHVLEDDGLNLFFEFGNVLAVKGDRTAPTKRSFSMRLLTRLLTWEYTSDAV